MKQALFSTILVALCVWAHAQNVGVNTTSPDASAALHVAGSNKGMLTPSVALTGNNDQTTVTDAPYPNGLVVYNSATVGGANAVSPGFYYWDGAKWQRLVTADEPDTDWAKVGGGIPALTDEIYHTGNVAIGHTDPDIPLHIKTDAGAGGGHIRIQRSSTDGEVGISMRPRYNSATNEWLMTVGGWGNTDDWVLGGGGNSNVIVAENTTGDIGLGVADPVVKLDVNGAQLLRNGKTSLDTSGAQLLLGYGGTNTYMHAIKTRHHSGQDANNAIDFFLWDHGTNASTSFPTKRVMTIDGSGTGMVGIGTPYPETRLHIKTDVGSGGGHLRIQRESTDGEVGISMLPRFASATNAWYMTVGGWSNTDDWVLGGGGSNAVLLAENGTGDIGINISDPTHKLHVDGDMKLGNNTTNLRTLYFGDGSYVYIQETLDDYMTIEANNGIRLGNDGKYFKGLYHGSFVVGDNNAAQCTSCAWAAWNGDFVEIQVNWSALGIPNGANKSVFLYCEAGNNTYTDHFMVSVQQIMSSRFDAFVRRVDSWDNGWGLTTLKIHYLVLDY